MKILIAADMEGISGIVHWDQVNSKEYERTRRLMTGDVNAAVRGAHDSGAEEVVVSDGHADARNPRRSGPGQGVKSCCDG